MRTRSAHSSSPERANTYPPCWGWCRHHRRDLSVGDIELRRGKDKRWLLGDSTSRVIPGHGGTCRLMAVAEDSAHLQYDTCESRYHHCSMCVGLLLRRSLHSGRLSSARGEKRYTNNCLKRGCQEGNREGWLRRPQDSQAGVRCRIENLHRIQSIDFYVSPRLVPHHRHPFQSSKPHSDTEPQ